MRAPMKLKSLLAGMALAMSVSTPSHAGLSDMQSFFDEVGVYGNASAPQTFAGQTRNYITGGSLTVRIPEKNYQLATFDPPRLSASCGGIDAFAGSFSFINSEQLVQMLQNIGNNAAGAVFQLALDSVSPQLGAVMKYFQDMANKINASNINSCEAGRGIVMATKDGKLQSSFMTEMKELGSTLTGFGSDWSAMTEKFQENPAEVKNAKTAALNSPALTADEKFWIAPGNVLWKALGKVTSGGSSLTNTEKLIIQSMVGTVIITEDYKGLPQAENELPLLLDPLDAFMGTDSSSNVSILVHSCGGTDCATVSNSGATVSIPSLRKIIHDKLQTTQDKIMGRTGGITVSDYEVVNMSFLPIWTMMESEYRTGGILGTLDTSEEVIALSYTKALLQRTLRSVRIALRSAKKAKNEGIVEAVKQLDDEITRINAQVDRSMAEKMARYNAFLTAKQALALEVSRVKEKTASVLTSVNRQMNR